MGFMVSACVTGRGNLGPVPIRLGMDPRFVRSRLESASALVVLLLVRLVDHCEASDDAVLRGPLSGREPSGDLSGFCPDDGRTTQASNLSRDTDGGLTGPGFCGDRACLGGGAAFHPSGGTATEARDGPF